MEVFTAYLPVWPFRRDHFLWPDRLERMVEVISGKLFSGSGSSLYHFKWNARRSELPKFAIDLLLTSKRLYREEDFLDAISITFEIECPSMKVLREEITPELPSDGEYISFWKSFAIDMISDELSIITVAMDLASPGSSFRGPYVIASDGENYLKDMWTAYADSLYEFAEEMGLVGGDEIDFATVWHVLSRVNGLRQGVPDTNFGKIISAITYIYKDEAESARFFKIVWACYGLEGFFADGSASRGCQVSEALSLFLALDYEVVKRLMKLLYDNRSKFIHGNKPLGSSLIEVAPLEGRSSTEEWDAEHVGSFFLMETARECIRRGIQQQKFKLSLD